MSHFYLTIFLGNSQGENRILYFSLFISDRSVTYLLPSTNVHNLKESSDCFAFYNTYLNVSLCSTLPESLLKIAEGQQTLDVMNKDNAPGASQSLNDASDDGHISSGSDSSNSSLLRLQIREQIRVIENLRCTVESQGTDLDVLSEELAESHKNLQTQESKRATLLEEFELLQMLIINPRNSFILPDGEMIRVNSPLSQSLSTTNRDLSQRGEVDDLLVNASLSSSSLLANSVEELVQHIEHYIGTKVSNDNIPRMHDITFAAEQQPLNIPTEVTFACKEMKHGQQSKSKVLQEADKEETSCDASNDSLQMMKKNHFDFLAAVQCNDDDDDEQDDKREQKAPSKSSRDKDCQI